MNSFYTAEDTLAALNKNTRLIEGQKDIALSFLQNKVPKILADDLGPASSSEDPEIAWCPPGHGDLYTALLQSGILDTLLEKGYKYAFVSNSDNLGASLDLNILGYFANSGAPMLMEVAARTSADKKGGHLALEKSTGKLILREVAQCPESDIDQFQDISKHRYFNTNSLWLDLHALKSVLDRENGVIPLPLIINKKTLDPRDEASPKVFQLESAMGAALSVFDGAQAIEVSRSRFIPVKKTTDLLTLWSDIYRLEESGKLLKTTTTPVASIDLDDNHFKAIDDFRARFSRGAPLLKECTSLKVLGDVSFGANVKVIGNVILEAKEGSTLAIPDDAVLDSSDN